MKKKMNNEDHLLKVKIVETCKLITETFQVNNVPLNVGVAALMAVLFITIEKTKIKKLLSISYIKRLDSFLKKLCL